MILTGDAALTILQEKSFSSRSDLVATWSTAEAHIRKYEMVDIMPLRYDVSLHGLDLVYVAKLIAQISSNFGEFR